MARLLPVMHESYAEWAFSLMTHPSDDMTTQYRIAQLEQGFREFKAEWAGDVRDMKSSIASTQTSMGAGLSAIQTQLAAMQVRDEQWKQLDGRLTSIERVAPDSLNGRVKQLEDKAWQIVLAVIIAAGTLVWTAVETIPKLKAP